MDEPLAKVIGAGVLVSGGVISALLRDKYRPVKRVAGRASEIVLALLKECCVTEGIEFVSDVRGERVDLLFVEVTDELLDALETPSKSRIWLSLEGAVRNSGSLAILSAPKINSRHSSFGAIPFPPHAEFCQARSVDVSGISDPSIATIISLMVERSYDVRVFSRDESVGSSRFFESARYGRPKAFVLNNYFSTAGGGERSTLDYAVALDRLGFEVTLVSTTPQDLTVAEIVRPFIDGVAPDWRFEVFANEDALKRAISDRDVEVFINHSYGSFIENRAQLGIYVVMFPHQVPQAALDNLKSSNRLCTISPFAELYVESMWGREQKSTVLVPPISDAHAGSSRPSVTDKQKRILVIGRFNVLSHNKNQLLAIEAFAQMKRTKILDDEWELLLVGNVNSSPENLAYLESCQKAGAGLPVSIRANASLEELLGLYQSATCLWQFTGYGLPFGESPQRCEHLGLVVMDCLAHGVIPLVFERSGAAMLIQEGVAGWVFGSIEQLSAQMRLVAFELQSQFHQMMVDELRSWVSMFDTAAFMSGLKRILVEEWREV
jgi:glycosyltransferase involved in cell wall biosynthesis